MPFFEFLDDNAGVRQIAASDPARFAPLALFTQSVLREESPLSVAERELIAAYVSGLNACRFCYGVHSQTAAQFGVAAPLLEALVADLDAAPVAPRLKPLLGFVRKLTLEPAKMSDADAQAVRDAGWSPKALQDAVLVCALFSFYNRLIEGHGIKGHPELYRRNGRLLAELGYGARPGAPRGN